MTTRDHPKWSGCAWGITGLDHVLSIERQPSESPSPTLLPGRSRGGHKRPRTGRDERSSERTSPGKKLDLSRARVTDLTPPATVRARVVVLSRSLGGVLFVRRRFKRVNVGDIEPRNVPRADHDALKLNDAFGSTFARPENGRTKDQISIFGFLDVSAVQTNAPAM